MNKRHLTRGIGICMAVFCHATLVLADDTQDLKKELEQLREQNRLMQQQLDRQQQMIDQLTQKVSNSTAVAPPPAGPRSDDLNSPAQGAAKPGGFSLGNLKISGEGAVGFFESGQNGYYPNAQFLVDEARLFLDAPLWENVYFSGELDLRTREAEDDDFHLGELYVDFQDIAPWGRQDHWLNIRAGQLYIPFGEEYLSRFAIDNPLISHSLSDIWGLSTGLEIYGSANRFCYALAAQSGGISLMSENEADKSISGRIGYDPTPWLHLSASAMRTGNVNAGEDHISALWFGNGFFHPLSFKGASLFHADLAELDAQVKWRNGSFKAAGGYADYNDNNPAADDHRDIYYYYGEWVQKMTDKLYGAARFSQIESAKGYPITANTGTFGIPTKEIWRLSLGLGYRFNSHLTLKGEYMMEQGQKVDGSPRNHEDLIAIEAAFKF